MAAAKQDVQEVFIPLVALSVRLQRVKLVQPNLAVAQGRILSRTKQAGFTEGEPCQIGLRSHSDVSRLQQYLDSSGVEGAALNTRKWWTAGEESVVFLHIRTALTKAIERNRHGTKLIECYEIASIRECPDVMDCEETASEESSRSSSSFMMHDKSKRHDLFADWLIDVYGKSALSTGSGILDVAGGKGELSIALLERGIPSVVLDPAPRLMERNQTAIPVLQHALQGRGLDLLEKAAPHEQEIIRSCSIIVGMHPDQATESIVLLSQYLKVPFALLPCCVMPSLFPYRTYQGRTVRSYRVFCQYLQAMQEGIKVEYLPFMGRNMILFKV